jgi:hypothetical protein
MLTAPLCSPFKSISFRVETRGSIQLRKQCEQSPVDRVDIKSGVVVFVHVHCLLSYRFVGVEQRAAETAPRFVRLKSRMMDETDEGLSLLLLCVWY